ncbi:MAG: hypothetical protein AAGD00_05040 [Planctomycetota bacterium]
MHHRIRALFGILTALLTLAPAAAQATDDERGRVINPPQLSDRPYVIDALDVMVRAPKDALIHLEGMQGAKSVVSFTPQTAQDGWNIIIKNSISSDKSLTLTQVLDAIVQQHADRFPRFNASNRQRIGSLSRAFGRLENYRFDDRPAARVYIDLIDAELPNDQRDMAYPVHGYTVIKTGPGQFLIFELSSTAATFDDRNRMLYEMVVATTQFTDEGADSDADRVMAILAAQKLGERHLTRDTLDDLITKDGTADFYRIYRPGPTGKAQDDQEVAWRKVTLRRGQRGELNPAKRRVNWTTSEREFGYLLQIDARAFWSDVVVDSRGIYWLSTDRTEEQWRLTNEVTRAGESQAFEQTFIRRDRRLTVQTIQPGQPIESIDYDLPENGYLSKIEAHVLPTLIAQSRLPGEYAFYQFDSNLGKVTLRRDVYERAADSWVLTSRPSDGALPNITTLERNGKILKEELSNGTVMTPSTRDRLLAIWSNKDLDFDD